MVFKKFKKRKGLKKRPRKIYGNPKKGLKSSPIVNVKRSIISSIDFAQGASGFTPPWAHNYVDGYARLNLMMQAQLSQLPAYTEFTNLFQQYRIMGCKVTLYPQRIANLALNNTQSFAPNLFGFIKQSSTGRPGETQLTTDDWAQIPNRKTMMITPGRKPIRMYSSLKQLSAVYNSAVNTDYAVQRPKFISTDETDAIHYGGTISVATTDDSTLTSQTAGQYNYKMVVTYYLQFRYLK